MYRRFQGNFFGLEGGVEGGGYTGGSLLGEIFHGGRKIQRIGRRIFYHYTMKKQT